MKSLPELLVLVVGIYSALGFLFAVPFVARGVKRIDPSAVEGTWGFRLLIVPGVVALWPLMLARWIRRQGPPSEWTPHRGRVRR